MVYAVIYCTWFAYLEKKVTYPQFIIHMRVDDLIPFCELFVIPYFLWFLYVSAVLLYCFFKNKQEYHKNCVFLFTGMTVFLVISTLWPNGHHLRPEVMPRENIFTALVAGLYRIDTPTNLWPSIHVYNSIGAHLALVHVLKPARKPGREEFSLSSPTRRASHTPHQKKASFRRPLCALHQGKASDCAPMHRRMCTASLILCTLITLSTVFLKQHSVFDVLTALVMAVVMYGVVYQADVVALYQAYRTGGKRHRRVRRV